MKMMLMVMWVMLLVHGVVGLALPPTKDRTGPNEIYTLEGGAVTLSWPHLGTEYSQYEHCQWHHLQPNGSRVMAIVYDGYKRYDFDHNKTNIQASVFGWLFTNESHPCMGGIQKAGVEKRDSGPYKMFGIRDGMEMEIGVKTLNVINGKDLTITVKSEKSVDHLSVDKLVDDGLKLDLPQLSLNASGGTLTVTLGPTFPAQTGHIIRMNDHVCVNVTSCSTNLCGSDVKIVIETGIVGANVITLLQNVTLEQTVNTVENDGTCSHVGWILFGVVLFLLLVLLCAGYIIIKNSNVRQKFLRCFRRDTQRQESKAMLIKQQNLSPLVSELKSACEKLETQLRATTKLPQNDHQLDKTLINDTKELATDLDCKLKDMTNKMHNQDNTNLSTPQKKQKSDLNAEMDEFPERKQRMDWLGDSLEAYYSLNTTPGEESSPNVNGLTDENSAQIRNLHNKCMLLQRQIEQKNKMANDQNLIQIYESELGDLKENMAESLEAVKTLRNGWDGEEKRRLEESKVKVNGNASGDQHDTSATPMLADEEGDK